MLPTFVGELGLDYPTDQGPLPGENLLGVPGGGLASGRNDYVIDYGQRPLRWIAVRTGNNISIVFTELRVGGLTLTLLSDRTYLLASLIQPSSSPHPSESEANPFSESRFSSSADRKSNRRRNLSDVEDCGNPFE